MSSNKPKLLIVDDRKENLFALEQLLHSLDVDVCQATTGNEALSLTLQEDFALVLLDVQMPEMDGYEVMALMSAEEKTKKLPVIFITAHFTDEQHKLKGYQLGAVDYIYKPFNELVLLTKVHVFLDLYRQRSENQRLQKQNQLILDSAGEGIFGVDPSGNINFSNPAAASMLGRQVPDLIGLSLEHILPKKEFENEKYDWLNHIIYKVGSTGYFHRIENSEFIKKDGTSLPVDYVITSIRGNSNEYLSSVIVFSDVTQRRIAEDSMVKLQQAQHMEAIGQLTGGLAHDFNNLLMVIQGNLELMSANVNESSEEIKYLQAAQSATERGTELIKRMLAFARKQTLHPEHLNLQERLPEIVKLLKPALGESIDIRVSLPKDLQGVCVDPGEFENALVNLAVNARDAMPGGGKIFIEAENIVVDAEDSKMYEVKEGEFVKVSITDSGTGITEDVKKRMFEPFFTTKERGKGTGLGLSMVYGFLKQSNGHITVYSEVNHGTTFHLYFPQHIVDKDAGVIVKTAAGNLATAKKGTETILVVEDEAQVRELTISYLKKLGYEILTASCGEEALKLLQKEQKIDLLFSDVVMPGGMTGPQLAEKIREKIPNIKILFASGYPSSALTNTGTIDLQRCGYLSKPYKLANLAEKIRSIIDDNTGE